MKKKHEMELDGSTKQIMTKAKSEEYISVASSNLPIQTLL
jgi:hypothetical protein